METNANNSNNKKKPQGLSLAVVIERLKKLMREGKVTPDYKNSNLTTTGYITLVIDDGYRTELEMPFTEYRRIKAEALGHDPLFSDIPEPKNKQHRPANNNRKKFKK